MLLLGGVDFEWLKGRFKDPSWMGKNGFTLARWWAGVLAGNEGEDAIHNAGTNLKALFVMGNGITSTAQTKKVKRGFR